MAKRGVRLAFLTGVLWVGDVVLLCNSTLAGAQSASFITPVRDLDVGLHPSSVAVGDFNGDGRLDVAAANNGSNDASVLLGNGDGTFQPEVRFAAGAGPYSVAVGDFNGDGKLDLAVANNASNNVSVLLGRGDGTFGPAVNFPAGPLCL